MPSTGEKVYLLERRHAFGLSLFVSFVIIFGAACILAYQSYSKSILAAIRSNETRATLLSKLILEHQRAAIAVLQSYADRSLLVDSVKRRDFEGTLRHLMELTKHNPEMDWPFIANPDSTVWINYPVDRHVLNKDLSHRDWYKGVSREWKPYISSVYNLLVGQKDLAVAVCVPIFDEQGTVIGILATAQSTAFFQKIIAEVGMSFGAKITLIDQEGHIIYSNAFPYTKEVIGYPHLPFVGKALKGEKDDVEVRDTANQGRIKYASFAPVEGIGWSVIVEKAKSEVFRSEISYLALIGVTALVIYGFAALSLVRLRKRHRQVKELEKLNQEHANLTSRIVSAQEDERKRVSYDLHDNVWQTLLAIRSEIERLFSNRDGMDGAALQDKSKKVMGAILDLVGNIRSMQADLWPYVLDDIGILATIDWYCREFEKKHSELTIETHSELGEDEVPSPAKIVIYRILQETLNNVVMYSRASHVTLRLTKKDRAMEFTVEDNGTGFDPVETIAKKSPWGGLGLLSIKARTELSGGRFIVESAKGKGTIVRAAWSI